MMKEHQKARQEMKHLEKNVPQTGKGEMMVIDTEDEESRYYQLRQ